MTKPQTKIPRFPVQEWLGKYEGWWLTMYGKKGFRGMTQCLERFFDYYSAYPGLEFFTITEIAQFYEWRLKTGQNNLTILYEVYAVKKFWHWLTEDKNLPLVNPVRRGLCYKIQRAHADAVNAKRLSRTETQIQIPPPNVRTAISYDNYDTSSWDFGVLQE